MSNRPKIRSTGYLPKGGRAAAVAHNEREEARVSASADAPAVEPVTHAVRTDVRGSVRPTWTRADRLNVAASSAAGSFAVYLLAWAVGR